jgi:hypothetical protein
MAAGTPTVFIQIWIDANKVQNGSSEGIYLNDNRVGAGSSNEGTNALSSDVTNGSTIQWNVFNIDPTSSLIPELTSIGNASIWGASGQPQSDGQGGFIGQVQATGSAGYQVAMNMPVQGGAGITLTVNPTMNVQ